MDEPQIATRQDFAEIIVSLPAFWGERDLAPLHHPMFIEEFGDSALVIHDHDDRVAAYLFGVLVCEKRLGYVHVIAVRPDQRNRGHGRSLYEAFSVLAARRGCDGIKAITTPSNGASLAFHQSLGMESVEVPDYAGPGQARVVFSRGRPSLGRLDLDSVVQPPVAGIVARAATTADADAVLNFWGFAAEDTDRPVDRRQAIEALIERDPEALVLAVDGDSILGCLIIGWDGWRAHLYRLGVHPEHRRRGIARWLLGLADRRLRTAGAIRIDAMVLDANDSAHRLWSAAGYSRQESWSRWIKPL